MTSPQKMKESKNVLEEDSLDEILSWGSPLSKTTEISPNNSPSSSSLDFLNEESNLRIQIKEPVPEQVSKEETRKRSIFDSSESDENRIEETDGNLHRKYSEDYDKVDRNENIHPDTQYQENLKENYFTDFNRNDVNKKEVSSLASKDKKSMWENEDDDSLFSSEGDKESCSQRSESEEDKLNTNSPNESNKHQVNENLNQLEQPEECNIDNQEGQREGYDEENNFDISEVNNKQEESMDDFNEKSTSSMVQNIPEDENASSENKHRTDIHENSFKGDFNESFDISDFHKNFPSYEIDREYSTEDSLITNEKTEFEMSEEGKSVCSESFDIQSNLDFEVSNKNSNIPVENTEHQIKNPAISNSNRETKYNALFSDEESDSFDLNFENKLSKQNSSISPNRQTNESEELKTSQKNNPVFDNRDISPIQSSEMLSPGMDQGKSSNSVKNESKTNRNIVDTLLNNEKQNKEIHTFNNTNSGISDSKKKDTNQAKIQSSDIMKDSNNDSTVKSKFSMSPSQTSKFQGKLNVKFTGNLLFLRSKKTVKRSQGNGCVNVQINIVEFFSPKLPEISENSFKDKRIFEAVRLPVKNIITDYPAIKSLLFLKDETIFTKDITFTVTSHVLNDCINNGNSLSDNPSLLLNSVCDQVKNNPFQFEILKIKLGLPYSFKDISIPVHLFNQIALCGNPSLIRSFIMSQDSPLLYFILFYKLNLVTFESYRSLFDFNLYYQFVLSKLGLVDFTMKSRSKWNLNSFINMGISKILNVNKIEQPVSKTLLETVFSDTKAITHNTEERNKLLLRNPDNIQPEDLNTNENQLQRDSMIGGTKMKIENKSPSADIQSTPPIEKNLNRFGNQKQQELNSTKTDRIKNIENEVPTISDSADKLPAILDDFSKLSIDTEEVYSPMPSESETKKARTSSIFEEDSESSDLFENLEISSPVTQNKTEPIKPKPTSQTGSRDDAKNLEISSPITQNKTEPINTSIEDNIAMNNSGSGKNINNSTSSTLMDKRFPAIKSPILNSDKKVSPPLPNIPKVENSSPKFSFPVSKKETSADAESVPTLKESSEESSYKKKFSKSFADIFSLESDNTTVSETPDLSSCFAEVNETDKPILLTKEPASSGFFSFFRRKPAVQAPEDPLLNRATRPLKAEMKVPEKKERKINQSAYANMKETSNVDIPGASTKK
jgi:hypothetical protein